MYPEPPKQSFLTPKLLIIAGILVIALTLGISYGVQYLAALNNEPQFDENGEELPSGTSVEVAYDTATFESEEQRFSIDYPKGTRIAELPKRYYQKSKRFFEGHTIFASGAKTSDPNYFRITINFQRNYQDATDRGEMLTSIFTAQRFCAKGNFKSIKSVQEVINDSTYVVRPDVRGCTAAYTTYYDTISRPGTYVIEIRSNQPYNKMRSYSDKILKNLALDNTP